MADGEFLFCFLLMSGEFVDKGVDTSKVKEIKNAD